MTQGLTIGPVFRCNAVSQSDLDGLPARVQELMARIRPHAVKLVDSWMIPDFLLDRSVSLPSGFLLTERD